MKKVHWYTCVKTKTGKACKCGLNRLNLSHKHFENSPMGVYVIWHNGVGDRIVKVGQGDLKDRFTKHRSDPKIQEFENDELMVSWIIVEENELDGVETYLGDFLNPMVAERFPETENVIVEIPDFIPNPNEGSYRDKES